MKRDRAILVLCGVGLVALFVLAFFLLFERVEEEIEIAPRAVARTNPYLAAERLLDSLGLPATSVRGPAHLPPTDHVLVLATARRTFGEGRTAWILGWVESGGHLVVSPRRLEEERSGGGEARDEEAESEKEREEGGLPRIEEGPDFLLDALGIEVDRSAGGEAELLALRAGPGGTPREVAVPRAPRLRAGAGDSVFSAGPEGGFLRRYRWGEGWVTVLADMTLFTNRRIGEHEHARFLWALITEPAWPAGVSLVYRDQVPSLRSLLVERAWMMLASAAFLLAAWLWQKGARFGPAVLPPPKDRRSLREHLEATAEFLWRRDETAALLLSQRRALLHTARRRHPAWVALAKKDQIRYLAELSGVAGGTLARALESSIGHDPEELVGVVRVLEKVRRSL